MPGWCEIPVFLKLDFLNFLTISIIPNSRLGIATLITISAHQDSGHPDQIHPDHSCCFWSLKTHWSCSLLCATQHCSITHGEPGGHANWQFTRLSYFDYIILWIPAKIRIWIRVACIPWFTIQETHILTNNNTLCSQRGGHFKTELCWHCCLLRFVYPRYVSVRTHSASRRLIG